MLDVLITLLMVLILFAIVAYILQRYVPMEPGLRNLVMLVLGLVLLIYVILVLAGQVPTWGGRSLR